MYQVISVVYRQGMLIPGKQLQGFQEGQRFELLMPYGETPWLLPVQDDFPVPAETSLAEATSGIVGLSPEIVQAVALDPALNLWGESE